MHHKLEVRVQIRDPIQVQLAGHRPNSYPNRVKQE